MPRLPRNLIKRGNRFYFRSREGGRDVRISLGTDLREARRRVGILATKVRIEAEQAEAAAQPREPTVAEFSERWLSEYVSQNRNPAGVELAGRRLVKHILPVLGASHLQDVSIVLLRGLRAAIEAKGLAPQTIRHVLSDVRCLLGYAVDVGLIARNPFRASVLPKIPEVAPRRLTEEELARVLAATPERFVTAVHLAVLTGLRWGELRRLQWRHIVWGDTPHLVLDRTKSGKVRRVPLVAEAVELLKAERSRTESVFVLTYRPLHAQVFVDPMREVVGFTWTFHQLRHTFACRWLEAGGSKEALQKILGHSTITMTERYGHLSDDAVFAEAKSLVIRRPVNGGTVGGTLGGTVRSLAKLKTS